MWNHRVGMAQLLIDHDADVNLKSNVQAILFTVLLAVHMLTVRNGLAEWPNTFIQSCG